MYDNKKKGKVKFMPKKGYDLQDNNAAEDKKPKKAEEYDSIGAKNKDIDKVKGVYLGEDKMFTGDPWVDIGIAAGRAYKKKKNAKK